MIFKSISYKLTHFFSRIRKFVIIIFFSSPFVFEFYPYTEGSQTQRTTRVHGYNTRALCSHTRTYSAPRHIHTRFTICVCVCACVLVSVCLWMCARVLTGYFRNIASMSCCHKCMRKYEHRRKSAFVRCSNNIKLRAESNYA